MRRIRNSKRKARADITGKVEGLFRVEDYDSTYMTFGSNDKVEGIEPI